MNLLPIPEKWEDAAWTFYEFMRRAVDGTVVPLFVDYTNQRVVIGATTASGSAGFQVLATAGTFLSGSVTAQNVSATGLTVTSTAHFRSDVNVTGTTKLLGNTIAASVTAAGLNVTSTAYFRSALTVTGEVIVSGAGTGITFPDGTKQITAAGGGLTGSILKSVSVTVTAGDSTTSTIPFDGTIPQNTEGKELVTVSITPSNSSSTLRVYGMANMSSANTDNLAIALFRDTNANSIGAGIQYNASQLNQMFQILAYAEVPANSTSSTTFKMRFGGNFSNTCYVNRTAGTNPVFSSVNTSYLIVQEISA